MSPIESATGSRVLLGLLLLETGVISENQLEHALAVQRKTGELLGAILVAHGYSSRVAIQEALAKQAGLLLESEHGYGAGLRAKLVQEESRLEVRRGSGGSEECAGVRGAEQVVEPRDDIVPADPEFDPWSLPLLDDLHGRINELERDLDDARHDKATLEGTLRDRDLRLRELESELSRSGRDRLQTVRPVAVAEERSSGGGSEDFPAVVERAVKHLVARRAQLDGREGSRVRHSQSALRDASRADRGDPIQRV